MVHNFSSLYLKLYILLLPQAGQRASIKRLFYYVDSSMEVSLINEARDEAFFGLRTFGSTAKKNSLQNNLNQANI